MATEDLKTFIEDRLRALDPGIDLDAGSPAQVLFIEPLLSYLGTDPFETDVYSFLTDRFSQEFPEIFGGDPGVINDSFVKPLVLFLEPWKREIQSIKRGQSLKDPSLLSDDDADALVANVFDERPNGGLSRGVARILFANPTNIPIEITTRFFTTSGLNFFPTSSRSVTAEEMVFNKQGALYYIDITVQAEAVGEEYNIDIGELNGVEGVFNPVSVTNTQKFSDGSQRLETPEFVSRARDSLTERSLVTRRGSAARLNSVFAGSLKAVQVVGAKDDEMQRDILVANSPGHAWLIGSVSIYNKIAFVQCKIVDSESENPAVLVGDELFIYLDKYSNGGVWSTLEQTKRFVRFTVEEVITGPLQMSVNSAQVGYLIRFSGDPPSGVTLPVPVTVDGGLSRKGTVRISSLPSIGATDFSVDNQDVHLYGHTDIYVRPMLETVSESVIGNLTNDVSVSDFGIQRSTLETFGQAVSDKNKVVDAGIDFEQAGVKRYDILTVEVGDDAGAYQIIKVDGSELFLAQNLSKNAANLRYSVYKSIRVNLFEPKVLKVPFGTIPNNDMQSLIGSNKLQTSTNLGELLVAEGDVVRIESGSDVGDFTITALDQSGTDVYVDRELSSTDSAITYRIFTPQQVVNRPLVRIKDIAVLDSARQKVGISVPPAEPVGVKPLSSFTSASVRGFSQRGSGFVLPALTKADGSDDYVTGGNVNSASGNRKYSLGFEPANGGTWKSMEFLANDPDTGSNLAEFLFPSDADLECSYFLATSEDDQNSVNYPPVDPKPGDALTLKNGPNKGSYLIREVIKFKHTNAGPKTFWSYFIKIHGKFLVDIFRSLIEFLDDTGINTSAIKISNAVGDIAFPGFFVNAYNGLGAMIHTALGSASPGASVLQGIVEDIAETEYEWGDPARGSLRTYFQLPVLFQQNTALNSNPTLFSFSDSSGDTIQFRPDPNRYKEHDIVPAQLDAVANVLDYPRDYMQVGTAVSLSDTDRPNPLVFGVEPGDTIAVNPETFFHGSVANGEDRQTAVQTNAGSTRIVAPTTASGAIFSPEMVGNILYLDEGQDAGGFTVARYIDARTLELNRALTVTTPAIILEGNGASWGYDGADNKLVATAGVFTIGHVGKYMTVYGIDTMYQGSYEIGSILAANTVELIRPGGLSPTNFPAFPSSAVARWVITDAPSVAPTTTVAGTELSGLQPIRMYNDVPVECVISDISTDPDTRTMTATSRNSGILEPYRIFRENIRRVTPAEMELHREGPFFYMDTDVVSLSPSSAANISKDNYLTVDDGTYESQGYKHIVNDSTLSYSTQETGSLEIPSKLLPTQTEDSRDGLLNLSGTPVQITYEESPLVREVQEFVSSAEDRVTVANILVRHFLPAYVSYHATYSGGSAPSVIAEDIIALINSITVESPIDVSEIQDLIADRGGNPDTPTKVSSLIHDWDRRQWAEISENELGGVDTAVPYNGTPRVSFLIAGPDVSGQETVPTGESINLTRE